MSQIWARCLSQILIKSEKWDKMRCILMWWCMTELKHIWITFESNLNKMFESDLNKIWVRSEQEKDKTQFNVMMHNKIKIHLSHIWVRFKQDVWNKSKQDLSQIWAELRWWRLNLKFLTLTLRHHTRQYMWFFDDRVDKMIFIECLLTIIQKIERLSSRKVIFSVNVVMILALSDSVF